MLQSALRRILGVCRATVSKMLISLEQLGLVKRIVYKWDRRQRLVRLTGYGRHKIRDAKTQFMHSGWADLAFASAIGSTGLCPWSSEDAVFEQKTILLDRLDALRNGFSDFATLEYSRAHPKAPDDLEDRVFSEPWVEVFAREDQDDTNAPPAGAEWRWSHDEPFPWADEGAATWEQWARERAARDRARAARERATGARGAGVRLCRVGTAAPRDARPCRRARTPERSDGSAGRRLAGCGVRVKVGARLLAFPPFRVLSHVCRRHVI